MPFGLWAQIISQMGPMNHVLDGGPAGRHWMGQFWGRGAYRKVWGVSALSSAKTAEPIDLPFALWTRAGRRRHKFNGIRQMAPVVPTHDCLGPSESITETPSRLFQPFLHRRPQNVPTFSGMLLPLKLPLPMGIWTSLIPWAHACPQPIIIIISGFIVCLVQFDHKVHYNSQKD